MYMYIYMYIYIYMYMYIYAYLYIYVYGYRANSNRFVTELGKLRRNPERDTAGGADCDIYIDR